MVLGCIQQDLLQLFLYYVVKSYSRAVRGLYKRCGGNNTKNETPKENVN